MPDPKSAEGHNSKAREADLLALMSEMRPALDKVEAAQAILKKAQQDYAVVRNKAEPLGFPLSILDKALKQERQPTNRRQAQADADTEYFVFKTLGLPTATVQGEMDFGSDEERDEKYWGDQGFQAGIRGDAAIRPDACAPHLKQHWLDRRAAGVEYSAWGKAEAGGRPDRLNTSDPPAPSNVSTIDEARAAREKEKPEGEGEAETTTPKGRPKGAASKDPLLQ